MKNVRTLKKWPIGHLLVSKAQQSRQHGCHARDLLLLVHHRNVRRVGLKVVRHPLGYERQQRQNVVLLSVLVQLLAQGLHEPRALLSVAPRVEARDGRVRDQEVGVGRNFVAHRAGAVRFGAIGQGDARVQLVTLAGLNEKQLRLTSQSRAMVGSEVRPNDVQLVLAILRVQVAEFAVRQDRDQDAVVVRVVHLGDCGKGVCKKMSI